MGLIEQVFNEAHRERRARLWAAQPVVVKLDPQPCEVELYLEPAPAAPPAPFLWNGKPYTQVIWENDRPAQTISIRSIIEAVAAEYGVSVIDLLSHRRTAAIVFPRQVAMYLATVLTLKSLPEIGRSFADRDHTTVLHASRKIQGLMSTDPELVALVEKLEARVSAQ